MRPILAAFSSFGFDCDFVCLANAPVSLLTSALSEYTFGSFACAISLGKNLLARTACAAVNISTYVFDGAQASDLLSLSRRAAVAVLSSFSSLSCKAASSFSRASIERKALAESSAEGKLVFANLLWCDV